MSSPKVTLRRRDPIRLSPHPQACQLEDLADLASTLDGPLAVDLFCGAGGLSQGLHDAGFHVVAGVERDRYSVETHRSRFPGASLQLDLSEPESRATLVNGLSSCGRRVDLIAGGPPCQPFSTAGKGKIRHLIEKGFWQEDARKSLWMAFLDVVLGVRPRAVLLENVPQMALGGDARELRALRCRLEQAGYSVRVTFLKASDHGVPQPRERLFLVAVDGDMTFTWPDPSEEDAPTLADSIADLPPLAGGEEETCPSYDGMPTGNPFVKHLRRNIFGKERKRIRDHYTRAVRSDDLEIFRMMNDGTRYDDLPEDLRRYRSDIFRDKYNRLSWDEPSRTITAHLSKDGYWYIHPRDHRTLSVREAARIQTFPDDFRFAGRMTDAYRQIGEAVPPVLARVLGSALIDALSGSGSAQPIPSSVGVSAALVRWAQKLLDEGRMSEAWMLHESAWVRFMWGRLTIGRRSSPNVKALKLMEQKFGEPDSILSAAGSKSLAMNLRTVWKIRGAAMEELASDLVTAATGLRGDTGGDAAPEGLSSKGKRTWQDHVVRAEASSIRSPSRDIVRVAERVFGQSAGKSRKLIQLLVAGLLGEPAQGQHHLAFAGARELGRTHCGPTAPECGTCPLEGECSMAAEHQG